MKKNLAGYRSELVVRPGDSVDFMVHSVDGAPFTADLVRIVSGDPEGPGIELEEVPSNFAGEHDGICQDVRSGSYCILPLSHTDAPDALTLALAVMPTLFTGAEQTIAELVDENDDPILTLVLGADGRLSGTTGDAQVTLTKQMPLDRWSIVSLVADTGAHQLTLAQAPRPIGAGDNAKMFCDEARTTLSGSTLVGPRRLVLASSSDPEDKPLRTFNGKLDSPRLTAAPMSPAQAEHLVQRRSPDRTDSHILGFWDFASDFDGDHVKDLGRGGLNGRLYNLPTRAMRGIHWTGEEREWRKAPWQYGAIHFHDTDVYDLRWTPSFSHTVPEGTRSGAYAARLRQGDEVEYITFFVSPPKQRRENQPRIAFVAPTASYLAYSNEVAHVAVFRALYGDSEPLLPEVQMFLENPAFGPSPYQSHQDGSGVHFVSHRRPMWNLRPDTRPWSFAADMNIVHWLETKGFEYDMITDHDLEEEGAEFLRNYDVAITGTHPEYLTSAMYDAYEGFLNSGGRLMYLGGNGFYWRVATSPHWPAAIEVRRAEDGNRGWVADAGEYYHAFDGEMGGLWRRQARSPNMLVGVGFTAQGFTTSTWYQRTDAASDPRAAFIFDKISGDVIGDFGLRGGGAAGEEVDRFDVALGSPPHGLVVARTVDHPEDMLLAKEEFLYTLPPNVDDRIHADIVFFETPSGGAVFSTGSIAWGSSLPHDNFDNNVSQMTENVLRRFADPTAFQMPEPAETPIPSPRASVPGTQRISS